ncbi:MAG TPA: hypothetical protein VGH92_13245 [Gaiellaceae bacterium]|jgi:hypothetical protein
MTGRLLTSFAVVALAAAALATGAGSSPGHDGMLYGCVYVENLGNSSNLDVLVWDKHAPHARGSVMINGGGQNQTENFTLDQHGWFTAKFNVTSFGDYTFKINLTKAKLTYGLDFNLTAANDVTSKGCKAH